MKKEEQQELKSAFDAVFDKKGKIKTCGRDACIHLISLMEKYTPKNIGDKTTGILNIKVIKDEYYEALTKGLSSIEIVFRISKHGFY